MKTTIVKIGNSRGVRIPKALLEQAGLPNEVELKAAKGSIVIRAAAKPRAGWAKSFKVLAAQGEEQLLIPDSLGNAWDKDDWQW